MAFIAKNVFDYAAENCTAKQGRRGQGGSAMTTGQLIFYAGVALLTLTMILLIVFAVKRPEYHPESGIYSGGDGTTIPLRNGYPTNPLTIRRDRPEQAHPVVSDETVPLQSQVTETILLGTETVPLSDSTMPLE